MSCIDRDNYKHYNLRGDVIVTTDGAGNVLSQSYYEAYGEHKDSGAMPSDKHRANTKVEDADTSLLLEGHRYRLLGAGIFLSPDPLEYVDGLHRYAYCGFNPWGRFDPTGLMGFPALDVIRFKNPNGELAGLKSESAFIRAVGFTQMIGGTFEIAAGSAVAGGGTVGSAGSASIPSIAVGGAIMLHGADNFFYGGKQMFTGEWQTTTTSQALQSMGMEEDTANLVDAGIGMAGGGAGVAKGGKGIAKILASEDAKGMSKLEALSRYEKGSKALSDEAYDALGANKTTPIQKALEMEEKGIKPPLKPLKAASLARTGLTPAAETVSGGAAAGAQASTQAARMNQKEDDEK